MNPTVSETRTRRFEGKRMARMVGSSVANIREETRTSARTEGVEQSRFAGVGIAYQRDGTKGNRIACFASQGALSSNCFDAGLNLG